MSNKIVRFWTDERELANAVKDSLADVVRRRPSVGWIRGDNAIDPKIINELESLRMENAILNARLAKVQALSDSSVDLSQDDDEVTFNIEIYTRDTNNQKSDLRQLNYPISWKNIVRIMQELIYREPEEYEIIEKFNKFLNVSKLSGIATRNGEVAEIEGEFAQKVRFQFEALGIIETFARKTETAQISRPGSFASEYISSFVGRPRLCWRFSETGKRYVARLNAIPKTFAM